MFEWLARFDRIMVVGPDEVDVEACSILVTAEAELPLIFDPDNRPADTYFVLRCKPTPEIVEAFSDKNSAIVYVHRRGDDVSRWREFGKDVNSFEVLAEDIYEHYCGNGELQDSEAGRASRPRLAQILSEHPTYPDGQRRMPEESCDCACCCEGPFECAPCTEP